MYKYLFWPNTSTNSRNIHFQFFWFCGRSQESHVFGTFQTENFSTLSNFDAFEADAFKVLVYSKEIKTSWETEALKTTFPYIQTIKNLGLSQHDFCKVFQYFVCDLLDCPCFLCDCDDPSESVVWLRRTLLLLWMLGCPFQLLYYSRVPNNRTGWTYFLILITLEDKSLTKWPKITDFSLLKSISYIK